MAFEILLKDVAILARDPMPYSYMILVEMEEDTRGVVRLGMPPDKKPEMSELHKHLVKYCRLWRAIGLKLGLKDDLLETISKENSKQYQECFRVMLQKWLIQDVSSTWNTLELAITNAQRDELSLDNLSQMPQCIVQSTKTTKSHDHSHNNHGEITTHSEAVGSSEKTNTALIINPNKAISEFVTTVSKIEKILMASGNEVDNLDAIKSICAFLPINNSSDKPMFTAEQLKEIDACSNVREIFRQLRFHLRWDDHLILTAILDRLDSKECEELLGKFQSKIDCQMKLEQIFDACKKQKQEIPKGFDKMVAIVNKKYSQITKEEYDQLKCFITDHCEVESYVLSPFLNMSPSSLLLEWLVPSTAITHMVEIAAKNKQIFIKESFVFLQIATTVILDIKSEELQHNEVQLERIVSKQFNKLVTSSSLKDREATLLTLKLIFDNVIQHPDDEKYRQIRLANKRFTDKVWQYPAGEELMKMSGWVVEGDHVRLRDESCVHIVSRLVKSFLSSSTGVAPFPDDKFQVLIKAFCNGDIPSIQKLLSVNHISPDSKIYSKDGSWVNLLFTATIAQQTDIVKLLFRDYSLDPYLDDSTSMPYVVYIFRHAPQSFIITILKYCGVRTGFKSVQGGFTLLHCAVIANCFDVVCFLEECSGIDVNATNNELYTPLHLAYLYGHTKIAQYLIQHGADVYAVDSNGHTPYEYIEGHPNLIKDSNFLQNRRKIHHIPYSAKHCYYMKLINSEIDEEEAISRTMEHFASLTEDGPTQPHDTDYGSALEEFTQFITKRSVYDPWMQRSSKEQREHILINT